MNKFINGFDYMAWQSLGVNNNSLDINNTYLYRWHFKNALDKFYAVFDIENMPPSFSKRLIFNAVFIGGVACAFDDDKYGLMCQPCTFRDVTVNYEPAFAVVSNPYAQIVNDDLKIGKDCELLHFDLNYCSIVDYLDYFATLKAQLASVIINQSRTLENPYIFTCENPKIAESFKKIATKISEGDPFIFADKNLFTVDGKLNMELFNKELGKNFIMDKVVEIIDDLEQEFLQTIGVPRMYFKKKERMTDDEVNKNDSNTSLLRDYWLDTLNESCEKINNMFNTDMSFKVSENVVNGGESNVATQPTENLL